MKRVVLLESRPYELPPVIRFGKKVEIDSYAEVNGTIWAFLCNNGLSAQEFYYWAENGWVNKSEPKSSGMRVPYKTLMRLREKNQ